MGSDSKIDCQAAYQAALAQQQAATQSMLLQQGQGHLGPHLAGQFAGQHSQVAAQVAAQLAVNPGYFPNPNINAAAAAAAAAAVQNMIGKATIAFYSYRTWYTIQLLTQ